MTRTYDAGLIRSILTHPEIYPFITDDGCPEASSFRPVMDERIIYLYEPPGFLALFAMDNNSSCMAHINVSPEMRGNKAVNLGKKAIEWVWWHTEYDRIWGAIAESNKRAVRYAQLCGMKIFGRNEKSFMKNGKLQDQILLGVSRG